MSKNYSLIEKKFNTNYINAYVQKEDSSNDKNKAIFDFRKNPIMWEMVNAGIHKSRTEILYVQYDLSEPIEYFFKYIPFDNPQLPTSITKLTFEIAKAIIQTKSIYWINPEDDMPEEFPRCITVEDSTIEVLKAVFLHL